MKERGNKARSVLPAPWKLMQECVELQASLSITKTSRVWDNQDKSLEVRLFSGPRTT